MPDEVAIAEWKDFVRLIIILTFRAL